MAAVRINRGAVEACQHASDLPRDSWGQLVRARRDFVKTHVPYDCRELLRFIEEAGEMAGPLGYESAEDLVRRGLELDPQLASWAVDGLRKLKPGEPVSFDAAVALGRPGAPKGNRNAAAPWGVNAQDGDENNSRNTKFVSDTADYVIARLDRDEPTLAARVRAGELSANAAAIQAGFRRRTVQVPADDPRRAAATIRRRLGDDFAEALREALGE